MRLCLAALAVALFTACTPSPQLSSARVTEAPSQATPTSLPLAPTLAPLPTPTATATTGRQTQDPTAVVVFAPSMFGHALADLGSQFMVADPGTTGVSYRFDTPAALVSLLQHGADADVFLSLDSASMDTLQQANLLDGPPSVLAEDQLVVVVPTANPQHLQTFQDLARSGVRFIVPAPSSPTTTALVAAFDSASHDPAFGDDFGSKADRNVLARDGNDQQVISRIVAGDVSAGVVYASSIDASLEAQLQTIPIPTSVSAPVQYPIGVLKNGSNHQGGEAFVKYALSAPAQDILSRYGFTKVRSPTSNATP